MHRRVSRRRFMAATLAAAPAALAARSAEAWWLPWVGDARAAARPPRAGIPGSAGRVARRLVAGGSRTPESAPARRRPGSPAPAAYAARAARPDAIAHAVAVGVAALRGATRGVLRSAAALHLRYYPWYGSNPWRHWDQDGRKPPDDIAAFAVPALGPYDSRDAKVIEQHARGSPTPASAPMNLSWWGPGSAEDRAVPLIMDVMRAHDIHVAFHLEPYADDRANRLRDDCCT